MNIREIQDRLIGAESVIRELSLGRVGPAPLRGQQLPYIHSEEDMRNWGHRRGDKRSKDVQANACRLSKEDDDGHAIYRREFWDQFREAPSASEVSEAHRVLDWVGLVDDEGERRALRAWAYAMAGGRSFARWCKSVEHITTITGRRRKNRAIDKILVQLSGKRDLHDGNGDFGVLPVTPVFEDISDTLVSGTHGETGLHSWASDEAFQPFRKILDVYDSGLMKQSLDVDQTEFNWAKRRNEVRRQREAKRRQKQAA